MINQSKINDQRFWKKWRESGAVVNPQEAYIKRIWGKDLAKEKIDNIKRAIAKYDDNHWWESKDSVEVASYQIFEKTLLVNFGEFHIGLEKLLGRPVFTHEFGMNIDELRQEAIQGIARRLSGFGLETSDNYKQEAVAKSVRMLQDYCVTTGKLLVVVKPYETTNKDRN